MFKSNRMLLMIALMVLCVIIGSASNCESSKQQYSVISSSKSNLSHKVIVSANPEAKIHVIKYTPKCKRNHTQETFYVLKSQPKFKDSKDYNLKKNSLKTIIKALEGNQPANTASTVLKPNPSNNYNPQQNGQNYVYNIQNHGMHHHYYGTPNATGNSQDNIIGFVPLEEQNDQNTPQWVNGIPLN